MKKAMLMMVVVGLLAVPALADQANISIAGLTGAEHWMWVEAEHAVIGGQAALVRYDNTDYSNWIPADEGATEPYTHVYSGYSSTVENIQFEFFLPAAMADPYINHRYSILNRSDVYMRFDLSGPPTGADPYRIQYFKEVAGVEYYEPKVFIPEDAVALADGATPALNATAGQHTMYANWNSGYNERFFDGFLIYDGPNADIVNGTVERPDGSYYMPAPGSTNAPVLAAGVAPTITGTGLGTLELLLNGVPYVSGTPITGAGNYELEARMVLPSGEVMAMSGANFQVVPEPMSMILLGLGGLAALRRRK
ncbi:MAG: PEP-CTERM sorting domain-containing protein [Sedimentisphaerales bacterium]|nr:PEP-CTERM sorting domain-containing protein [Sedimentisphaerales bacterium]